MSLLNKLAAQAPTKETPKRPTANGHAPSGDSFAWLDSFLARNAGKLPPMQGPEAYKGGRKWVFDWCPWNPEQRDNSAFLIQEAGGKLNAGCHHDSCKALGAGWPSLRAMIEPKAERATKQAAENSPADEKPDPEILPMTAQALPEIPADVLPQWAGDFARSLSAAKEIPLTMAVLLELAVLAASCQRVYRLRIEQNYFEALALYCAPSMESGERKTATVKPITAPLFALQGELRNAAAAAIEAAKVRRKLAEGDIRRLEKQYYDSEDEAERETIATEIEKKNAALPAVPTLPQLVVEDFTEGALGMVLRGNGESALAASDEGGLFDNLAGRYSDTSEIDLFLKAHVGSPHTVNRVGREGVFLRAPLISVAISPQPGILEKLGDKEGFIERGLVARFLFALPESRVGNRKLLPAKVPEDVEREYRDNLMAMARAAVDFKGEEPKYLRLSEEAYALWKAFERAIEPRMRKDGDLFPVKAWASKLPGAVARIAAVCHCADYFRSGPEMYDVPADRMAKAIDFGGLLIPHSLAVHRLMVGGGFDAARAVVDHYESKRWPAGSLSMTDWWRPVRSIVGETSSLFEPIAERMADHGYLIPTDPPQRPGKRGQWFRANRQLIRKSESP